MTSITKMSDGQWVTFVAFSFILLSQIIQVRSSMTHLEFFALYGACELIILGVIASFTK